MKKRNIKSLTIGLLTITLLGTVLVGCSDTDNKKVDSTNDSENQEDVIGIPEEDSGYRNLVLNELIEYEDFTMIVTNYKLVKDQEGKDALVITYDWENKLDEPQSPFVTYNIKGYQDSVETGNSSIVEGIDLEATEKEYKTGEKLKGGQATIDILDIEKDLLLELSEQSPSSNKKYSTTIKLSDLE